MILYKLNCLVLILILFNFFFKTENIVKKIILYIKFLIIFTIYNIFFSILILRRILCNAKYSLLVISNL